MRAPTSRHSPQTPLPRTLPDLAWMPDDGDESSREWLREAGGTKPSLLLVVGDAQRRALSRADLAVSALAKMDCCGLLQGGASVSPPTRQRSRWVSQVARIAGDGEARNRSNWTGGTAGARCPHPGNGCDTGSDAEAGVAGRSRDASCGRAGCGAWRRPGHEQLSECDWGDGQRRTSNTARDGWVAHRR